MKNRAFGWLALAAVALGLSACASAGNERERTDRNRLTAEEIMSVDALTLYDVVYRLRPRWLEVRAPRSMHGGGADEGVVVFLDRTLIGGPEELRRLGPRDAAWLQYMPGTEAAARLPGIQQRNVEGAIIIHSRAESSR